MHGASVNISNLCISVLAILISGIAIIFSVKNSIKSNNVTIISNRIDCLIKIQTFFENQQIFSEFDNFLNIKSLNSPFYGAITSKTPVKNLFHQLIYTNGCTNPFQVKQKFDNNVQILETTKILFGEKIYIEIDNFCAKYKDLFTAFSKSLSSDDITNEPTLKCSIDEYITNFRKFHDSGIIANMQKIIEKSMINQKKLLKLKESQPLKWE